MKVLILYPFFFVEHKIFHLFFHRCTESLYHGRQRSANFDVIDVMGDRQKFFLHLKVGGDIMNRSVL